MGRLAVGVEGLTVIVQTISLTKMSYVLPVKLTPFDVLSLTIM